MDKNEAGCIFLMLFIVVGVIVVCFEFSTTETIQTIQYCSESTGIVFERSIMTGLYNTFTKEDNNFRFMTPTEFKNYCVEGTK